MVLIGIDPYPYQHQSRNGFTNLRMFAIVSSKSILHGLVPMCLRSLVCDVVEPGVELNAAPRDIAASSKYSHDSHCKQKHQQWIGLREHLQETTLLRCFPALGMMDCECKLLFHESKEASRDGWNMQWHERALMLVGINPSPQPMDRSMNDSRYVHLISVQMLIAILFANNSRIVSKLWQLCLESIDWSRGKDMEDEMIFTLKYWTVSCRFSCR